MYTHITKLRVRYSDTDQMKYILWCLCEIFRDWKSRTLKINWHYKQIEELGFGLPVVNLKINYRRPKLFMMIYLQLRQQ